jgi:hypothetical protein
MCVAAVRRYSMQFIRAAVRQHDVRAGSDDNVDNDADGNTARVTLRR